MKTIATMFTGGGLFDVGAEQAGLTSTWGIEIEPDIADCAERNISDLTVLRQGVETVDYTTLSTPHWLHASPVCKNASVAKQGGEEQWDIDMGMAVAKAIKILWPSVFSLENVWGYRNFEAFKVIVRALTETGYAVDWWLLNAADYGVPQTRKRLILIASREKQSTKPQPTHSKTPDMFGLYKPWVGWYEAIADLIPTLPDSHFAPWQLARLPDEVKTFIFEPTEMRGEGIQREKTEPICTIKASRHDNFRAFITDLQNATRTYTTRQPDEPFTTVLSTIARRPSTTPKAFLIDGKLSTSGDKKTLQINDGSAPCGTVVSSNSAFRDCRAFMIGNNTNDTSGATIAIYANQPAQVDWLSNGRVVKMTPRALARFQSFPDSYLLPDNNALAVKVIGNAVPPLLAQRIVESVLK